jgi:hypothetical protein
MQALKRKVLSRSLPAALASLFIGLTPALADESLDESLATRGNSHRIEGVWLATVTLTNCATGQPLPFPEAIFDAMAMFASNGTFHDTNENSPTVRSAAFGAWEHIGGRRYEFAFRFFRFDATGMKLGSQIVRHAVRLSRDGKSYTSSGTAEFYDVSGIRMLPDGCSTSTATRFK